MIINQIYSTINSIAQNMTEGKTNVVDYSTFVSFGNDVLSSSTNKETFYNKLVDRIGKTIFAIREYKADNRHVLVDSFTFGSILQKISYSMQDAENNESWTTTASNPYTWKAKGGIHQKLFAQSMPTFAYKDVIYDNQLESAFLDEVHMSGFINGLYTRMRNALEVDIEGMNNTAIVGFIGKVFEEVGADTPVNTKRARNLLAEYNTAHASAKITSVQDALESQAFLEFACIEIGIMPEFLRKMSSQYNDGTVERFTTSDKLVCEVNTMFEKAYSVYLKSNTYHDELVALPNYSTVAYWQNPIEPMAMRDSEGAVIKSNIICVMRDEDAVATTLERENLASQYDNLNNRTYVKLSADRRYIADTSENAVVFYLEYIA